MIENRELIKMAEEMLNRLESDGDPHNGDDWSLFQIVSDYLKIKKDPSLIHNESELYRSGYEKIGAMDISNYLARCQIAGKIPGLEWIHNVKLPTRYAIRTTNFNNDGTQNYGIRFTSDLRDGGHIVFGFTEAEQKAIAELWECVSEGDK